MLFNIIITDKNYSIMRDQDPKVRVVDVPDSEINEVKNDEGSVVELVFYYGQNEFQPANCPSVSVGDIAIVNNKFFVYNSIGKTELKPISKDKEDSI